MSDYHCPKHGVRWWDYSHDASNPDLRCIQCEIERAESAESQLRQVKADAERIDWLEAAIRKSGDIEYADKIKNTIDDEYQRNGGDLRVAIDFARRNDGTA